ncbi:hypothetical protein BDV25DRAFT_61515 [Aspergillus avenaceus]|uniref:FAD-binding PCMH-type domain-containing protein n=1 Tax=Aspergillus avenaceus TaxID=36643 RepID=A0A5N6U1S9_ASPAV|nr:hypothetical protein BDV25DRAFT_61515 [Aspergillus avenaceus]
MSASAIDATHIAALRSFLHDHEIITPASPSYRTSADTWSAQKYSSPRLVIRPTSIDTLRNTIAYLYTTDLDIAIYGHGFSSASAGDVVVNMSAFDEFHLDAQSKLTIGAGQTWADVYKKLGEVGLEYGVVGARTPCVGVAGTIVRGGFSWLSSEHGCISDPVNMLDAQVVKYDGSVVWASTEPELLWALRGGGGGFGVLVTVKLRVFPYPQNIWAGQILIPRESLEQVADGIENFLSKPVDPKITMFLYVVKGRLLESIGSDSDMLVIHAFDANGEKHGRANFQWALNIDGAVDQTMTTNLAGVANLQDKADIVKGTMTQFWQPLLLRNISKETVIKAIKWFEEIRDVDESLGDCTYLIFELLSSRDPVGGTSSCAWPRPSGMKHILLLGTGCPAHSPKDKENLARDLAIQAPSKVLGDHSEAYVLPNGFEEYHDWTQVWGPHFAKLQTLRNVFDPRDKFKGVINPRNN